MMNNQMRPSMSPSEAAAMMAQFRQMNPQMFARLQAMRPEMMQTASEHLMMAAANSGGGHGHSHTHSANCRHGAGPSNIAEPHPAPPPPPPAPLAAEMAIVQAVQYNEVERVKELIEKEVNNVNAPDSEGCYLLHWAAINNHVEIIRYLIAKGATVDIKGGDLQSTPVHWACRQGCTEAFLVLVDNGASIESTDNAGIQPVHIAAQYGQIKILAYLLASGVNVESRDNKDFTPLIYSCIGPPPNYSPSANATHVCCTQFLVTFGANINYQEPLRQYTPMHFAINNKNPISFRVLLKAPHINIQLKNSEQLDPLTFARLRQNLDALSMLEDRIQSTKLHIRPVFLQRYFTQEIVRKWTTRGFIFLVLLLIGLAANAMDYAYWMRIVFPIVIIFGLFRLFDYYVFDEHCRDNFAFSYVLSSTLLMYATYWLYLQNNRWSLPHICYHLFTFYGLYSVRRIKKINPGFLKRTSNNDSSGSSKEKMCLEFARDPRWTLEHFCVTCLIRRPLRSKHCPVDGTCVAKFDHHCTWLDACIGARNHFHFIRVLTFGSMALILWMYQAVNLFIDDSKQFTLKYLFLEVYDPWFVYMLILTGLNSLWVLLMTFFNLSNSIFIGVTINERLTRFRYVYFRDTNTGQFVNPFARSKLRNFLETFGLFRLMIACGYPPIDWSQIYDINQISTTKIN